MLLGTAPTTAAFLSPKPVVQPTSTLFTERWGRGLITDPDTTLCDGKGATLSVWTERVERKLLTERKA